MYVCMYGKMEILNDELLHFHKVWKLLAFIHYFCSYAYLKASRLLLVVNKPSLTLVLNVLLCLAEETNFPVFNSIGLILLS